MKCSRYRSDKFRFNFEKTSTEVFLKFSSSTRNEDISIKRARDTFPWQFSVKNTDKVDPLILYRQTKRYLLFSENC